MNKIFDLALGKLKFLAISMLCLVVTFVAATFLWTRVMEEFGVMTVLLGVPGSLVIGWIMSRNPYGNGGGGDVSAPSAPKGKTSGKIKLPNALNSWALGVILWVLVLAAYVYFGYFWAGMPLWLGVFTLLAIPIPQTIIEMLQSKGKETKNTSWTMKLLDLLGAGKAWRGVLVLVVLVAESMLYWYFLLPSVPTVAVYLLLMVITILGARRMVAEESHVTPDSAAKGGDDQSKGDRKSGDIGKPPGAD